MVVAVVELLLVVVVCLCVLVKVGKVGDGGLEEVVISGWMVMSGWVVMIETVVVVVVIVGVCFYVLVVVGVDGIDICCGSGDDSSHINYNYIKHCKSMTHCAPLFVS